MRYGITLNYDGSAFCGWQVQPDAPSVQETVEKALSTLLKGEVNLVGAGRTDTGVNAVGYVAHFDFDASASPLLGDLPQLVFKLNAILPGQISVSSVEPADDDFHARFSAARREYRYFIHRHKDPFADRYSWLCSYPELDFDAMNKAAALLRGTHDFSCFEKTGADNRTSVCTVFDAYWRQYTPELCTAEGEYWYFSISADRFLRNMVRAVVGTLVEVGRGKRSIGEFASLVLPPSGEKNAGGKSLRCLAGQSVPGNALFLTEVRY